MLISIIQSLINRFFKYKNGIVEYDGELFNLNDDEFFLENKFKDINTVSKNLKTLYKNKNKVTSLELKKNYLRSLEFNMKYCNFILTKCSKLHILSTVQYEIIKDRNRKTAETKINNLLEKAKGSDFKLNDRDIENTLKIYAYIFNYNKTKTQKFLDKFNSTIKIIDYSVKYSFNKTEDIKLGMKCNIVKAIEKYIRKNPINEILIVYMEGVLTYTEYRQISNIDSRIVIAYKN